MDILAMVALGARAGRVISPTEAGVCAGQGDTLRVAEGDYAALGALYERAHRPEQAIWAYQRAIEDNRDARATAAAWQSLSLLYKRLGRYEEAVAIWQARVTGPELYPHLELAKHLEHRQRDFAAAQGVVEEALARVQAREITISPWERRQTLTELEQRLARLQKRTQRTVSPPSTANGESKPS
jgi:tetratricopeptide (TPR) repeat protein